MELNLGWACPAATGPEAYDVIIIGGGPAGASAAIYTSRSDLRTLVIDKGLTAGALGVTAKISNYPGIIGPISGAELVDIMRTQAESFGAEVHHRQGGGRGPAQRAQAGDGRHGQFHGQGGDPGDGRDGPHERDAGRRGVSGQGRELLRHV